MQSDDDGFARAAQALLDQVITTDTWGLLAGEVSITVADGQIPGYRAAPAGPGPHPVVLVVQEIFGVHEHIRDVCRRLAKQGYFAIAPDLYVRQGDVSQLADIPEIFSKVVLKVPDAQVCADLDAALAFARDSGQADADRCALVGFCWGGRPRARVCSLEPRDLRQPAALPPMQPRAPSARARPNPLAGASSSSAPPTDMTRTRGSRSENTGPATAQRTARMF
jgi:dienelactone hydrolase